MNITVLSPVFYSTPAPVWRLLQTADKFAIRLHLYGMGEHYKGWADTHVVRLATELERLDTTHFLFTDSIDAFFLGPLEEIERKYQGLGFPPMLMSKEHSGLNAGQCIGEREWMLRQLAIVATLPSGDPQVRWRSREWDGLVLDEFSDIFQVMTDGSDAYLSVEDGRLVHVLTGKRPSLVHFAGGYSHPEFYKEAQMGKWWGDLAQ